ncbi:TPA: hypothetical protein DDZ86_00820 [Candidatus Dependentiae bacterium]|nr:MAG: General secretion pathway protein D [candidate division TM6 bacterium GW2011_GWF2_43_87]HBL98167.1 hypothetical protein [Candidatus Dependentiae bacterium]
MADRNIVSTVVLALCLSLSAISLMGAQAGTEAQNKSVNQGGLFLPLPLPQSVNAVSQPVAVQPAITPTVANPAPVAANLGPAMPSTGAQITVSSAPATLPASGVAASSSTSSSLSSATLPVNIPAMVAPATPQKAPVVNESLNQSSANLGPAMLPAPVALPAFGMATSTSVQPIKVPSVEKEEPVKILSLPAETLRNTSVPTSVLLETGDESAEEAPEVVVDSTSQKLSKGKDPFVVIKKNEKLSTFIEKVAAKKGINIVLPQGAELMKESVNFAKNKRMLLSDAERYLHMLLEMSGYSIRPAGPYFIVTKLNEVNFARGPFNLYVDVDPDELPVAEDIRAIYFLSNFRVPENTQGNEPINVIIRELMGTQQGYLFDIKSNAVILVGPAEKIAYTMRTVLALDEVGSPEKVAVIPLFNSAAPIIAKLLTDQILASMPGGSKGLRPNIKTSEDLYFAPSTRVIADGRTNSLVVVGQETAISRIRTLIRDYLDQPQDSGKSVLHVYDLQYLNSKEFAPLLQRIVDSSGGSGQSKKEQGGTDRAFDDVIIVAEEEVQAETKTSGGTAGAQGRLTIGGNRLIIACNAEDWKQIKPLIEQLDKQNKQVIFEVMVFDFTNSAMKQLRSQTRNPVDMGLGAGVTFQSANISNVITGAAPVNPTPLLNSDLLQLDGAGHSMAYYASLGLEAGSMILSLRDPARDNIWSVIKMLDKWTELKVVSQLFIVAKNNTEATTTSVDAIRSTGEASSGSSGVTTLPVRDFNAEIKVAITPRISSIDRLTIQTRITMQDFLSRTTFERSNRAVETSATLNSGQILIIGGLEKVADSQDDSGTPFLSRIPIIGNLFKGSGYARDRGTLAIFIHPTILDPKLRSGYNTYTKDKITDAREAVGSADLFSGLKDPVTRIFFSGKRGEEAPVDMFERYYERGQARANAQSQEQVAAPSSEGGVDDLKVLLAKEKNPFKH